MTVTHPPVPLRMTPARWVALAIGLPLALALIAWSGFTMVAAFGQASFPVGLPAIGVQHGQLSVSVGGGNVTVRPGQGSTARLAGTVRYSLVRPGISTTGDSVNLHCRLSVGDCGLDATLWVPPGTGVTLSSGGGDLTVSGLDRGADLSSGGGNISVSGVAGKVTVSSGGGDVNAEDLGGTLSFSTDGGNVGGTALSSPGTNIASGGGDVTLTFTAAPRDLEIRSDGGNVTVVLPRTQAGYAVTTNSDGGNASVSVDRNSGSPYHVDAESGGGNITITQAG